MARKPGQATTPRELGTWKISKILGEIRKQIRSDWGGLNRADAIKFIQDNYTVSAGFVYDMVQDKIAGCRYRVESKIAELERRLR